MKNFFLLITAFQFVPSYLLYGLEIKPDQNVIKVEEKPKEKSRKKILDHIRRGVVVVKTNSHAGNDPWASKQSWIGTGFVVDMEKGIIATNRHVVGRTSICTYEIKFSDGTSTPGMLLYYDPQFDFAFIKVDPSKLPAKAQMLEFANREIKENEEIYSMGNSGGDEFSTYKGIVSSLYETVGTVSERSFKFSGLTVGGASGSPIFAADGKVLGILYGGRFISGLALPICYIQDALDILKQDKTPVRRTIGVNYRYRDIEDIKSLGWMDDESIQAYQKDFSEPLSKMIVVDLKTPAMKSFEVLRTGDIVTEINGKKVGADLYLISKAIDENAEVTMVVYRNGKRLELKVSTEEIDKSVDRKIVAFAGGVWYQHDNQSRMLTGEKEGVYVTVAESSPLREALKDAVGWGSISHIRILEMNKQPINTLEDLIKVIPDLQNKKVFELRFINYKGENTFDGDARNNRLEQSTITKYESKFDEPKLYQQVEKKGVWEWEIKKLYQ